MTKVITALWAAIGTAIALSIVAQALGGTLLMLGLISWVIGFGGDLIRIGGIVWLAGLPGTFLWGVFVRRG